MAATRVAISLSWLWLLALPACDENPPKTTTSHDAEPGAHAGEGSTSGPISPAATVRLVNQHRRDGRLAALGPLLLPQQRPHIIELIQSVDRLRWANQVLTESVAKRVGESTAKAFDRAELANIIGVFSWDVAVIDETIEGDRATVSFQIGDRLPLERVQLLRQQGGWVIQTDPPIPQIAGELLKLAEVMSTVARQVDKGGMTVAQIRRELEALQAPVMRRLSTLLSDRTAAAAD